MGSAFGKMRVKVLIVGLDNSGKTSIVQFLRKQQTENIAPTVGYNSETLEKYNLNFNFTDMSGQQQYRDMWEQFAQKIDGLIFVIDSSDQLRYSVMANEFQVLIDSFQNGQIPPLLIYANKSDHQDSQNQQYFIEYLQLHKFKSPWFCISSSVKTQEGIEKGMEWLSTQIQAVKKR